MSVHPIAASDALAKFDSFSAVIDARSESEWSLDHLPGALNWPSLHDEERVRVGTLYKQISPFEAQKIGAALVARNIAAHIEREVLDKPKHWQPLIYCWRGGKRSNSLALVLGQIGFRVHVIEGGYKAFRRAMLDDLPMRVQALRFRVVCGPTGSGKTRLLQALARVGAQVLDLEALACHRSSVLGAVPGQAQPSQKRFDTLVWDALRRLDAQRTVWVEAESQKVGNVRVPESLMHAIRESPCLQLTLPENERVALLLEDYPHLTQDVAHFCSRLDALVALRGHAAVKRWKALAQAGDFTTVVRELLQTHYDPGYAASTRRNFRQFGSAAQAAVSDHTLNSFMTLARELASDDAEPRSPLPAGSGVQGVMVGG